MEQIILFKSRDGWMTETLVNGKPHPQQIEYFGTHILPTAFTAMADAQSVLKEITELNPNAIVTLK